MRGDLTVPSRKDVDGGPRRARESSVALYYVGRRFAGLPLTDVGLEGPSRAVFFYGTCVIPAEQREGGCSVPIQIQNFPFEARQWRLAAGCHRRPELRGVPTVRHDGLVLFTGDRIVKIYARTPAEDRRVALALRNVRDTREARLPAPSGEARKLQAAVCR